MAKMIITVILLSIEQNCHYVSLFVYLWPQSKCSAGFKLRGNCLHIKSVSFCVSFFTLSSLTLASVFQGV